MISVRNVLSALALLSTTFPVDAKTTTTTSTCERFKKNPTPKGIPCGTRGSLTTPSLLLSYQVISPDQKLLTVCRDSCMDSGDQCLSFAIDDNTSTCRLYTKSLSDMKFKKSADPTRPRFYGRTCFYQTCTTVEETVLSDDPSSAYDDNWYQINLPFPVNFYGHTYKVAYMSVNGFLSFSQPQASWQNSNLPAVGGTPSQYLPPETLAVFWDDLNIPSVAGQSCIQDLTIAYRFYGVPNRRLEFEWRTKNGAVPDGYVNVILSYNPDNPGIWEANYVNLDSSDGNSATVGMQALSGSAGPFEVYSFNQPLITPGTCLSFRANAQSQILLNQCIL